IKSYYTKYEKQFEFDMKEIESKFDQTMLLINEIFNEGLKNTEFRRIHLFYTLFTSIYHFKFGLSDFEVITENIYNKNFERIKKELTALNEIFKLKVINTLPASDIQFLDDSRSATTDTKVRNRRTEYITNKINAI